MLKAKCYNNNQLCNVEIVTGLTKLEAQSKNVDVSHSEENHIKMYKVSSPYLLVASSPLVCYPLLFFPVLFSPFLSSVVRDDFVTMTM